MSGRFLITGLPRSRTAWFSVVASTPRSICYHEPVAHTASFDEIVSLWRPSFGVSIGIADSSLALHLERIIETIGPRTLIVERPIDDVMASMAKYLAGTGIDVSEYAGRAYLELLHASLSHFRDHPLVKRIRFDAVNDYDAVRAALQWLVPDVDFLDLRALMSMNIQVDRRHLAAMIRRPHNHWYLAA